MIFLLVCNKQHGLTVTSDYSAVAMLFNGLYIVYYYWLMLVPVLMMMIIIIAIFLATQIL